MRTVTATQATTHGARTWSDRWIQVSYVATDLFYVFYSSALMFTLRYADWATSLLKGKNPGEPILNEHLAFALLYAALVLLICHSQGLYKIRETRPNGTISLAVIKSVTMATLLLVVLVYLSGVKSISRLIVVGTATMTLIFLIAWRWWQRKKIAQQVAEGRGVRNVLIAGAGSVGQGLARYLESHKHLGYAVVGFLDDSPKSGSRILGSFSDIASVARSQFVDEILVTIPSEREIVKRLAIEARLNRLEFKVIPDLYDGLVTRAPIEHLGDFPVMTLHQEPIPVIGLMVKRLIDVVASALGLLVLSPVLVTVAFAIKMDSQGPVFYRALRVGKKGRRFLCCKFRTMVPDADIRKDELRHLNERQGATFKIVNDPRLTRIGRKLRKYSLDELPQLWNVLRGEMSLVGPRPHPVDDYQQYSLAHLRRLDVTPGITGLWQISARSDPSFEKNVVLDLEYIENWNPWLDIEILLRTVPVVFKGSGE